MTWDWLSSRFSFSLSFIAGWTLAEHRTLSFQEPLHSKTNLGPRLTFNYDSDSWPLLLLLSGSLSTLSPNKCSFPLQSTSFFLTLPSYPFYIVVPCYFHDVSPQHSKLILDFECQGVFQTYSKMNSNGVIGHVAAWTDAKNSLTWEISMINVIKLQNPQIQMQHKN